MNDSIKARKAILEAEGFTMIDCIEGLGGMYGINENGDIFSIRKMRLLKRCKHSLGYQQVYLSNLLNNGGKWYKVHRLVGMQFIPNPDNLTDINHKDGIKTNNKKANLEWMSHSDNILHSFRELGRTHDATKTYKKVSCSNGKTYDSLKSAYIDTGCKIPNISACLNGKIKHTKKLVFSFL
ncbi:MAG: HNH endonuclease [Culicoidibacterales bacterium]